MPQNNVDVTQLDNLSQQELIALRDSYERGELSGGDELKEQITIDELRETLAQAGFHGPLVDIYLKAIDERNKGKLDFYDLIGLYILKGATVKEDRTKRIFDFFDKDKNGVIDKSELTLACQMIYNETISEDKITETYNQLDLNQDGVISCSEFAQLIEKLGPWW